MEENTKWRNPEENQGHDKLASLFVNFQYMPSQKHKLHSPYQNVTSDVNAPIYPNTACTLYRHYRLGRITVSESNRVRSNKSSHPVATIWRTNPILNSTRTRAPTKGEEIKTKKMGE